MSGVSVIAFGSYLPGAPIAVEQLEIDGDADSKGIAPLLRPPTTRHHVARGERAAEMVERAARPMFDRLGLEPSTSVDLIITNTLLPDTPITGCGAEAAQRLGCAPEWIVDLHNGGCGSFPYMLRLAEAILASGSARSALLCNTQNIAGQMFMQPKTRRLRQSSGPGDGCGVAYVVAGDASPVLGVHTHNRPSDADDMRLWMADGRRYWEPGESEMTVQFDEQKTREIIERGNRLVPAVVAELCERIDVRPSDIDVLVTNQPNRLFLRTWRRALGIDSERHLDTFDRFGNLYGAAVPVTLDHALRAGDIRGGDLVVCAGFAHAGDFAAAAALRWQTAAPGGERARS
jgi:3-oxoacyl-[acyl-carrier-protein] synthase-3